MLVDVIFISHSSDFVLYLEDSLMLEHYTWVKVMGKD